MVKFSCGEYAISVCGRCMVKIQLCCMAFVKLTGRDRNHQVLHILFMAVLFGQKAMACMPRTVRCYAY